MDSIIIEYTEDMVYVIEEETVETSITTDSFYYEVFSCSAEHPIEVADKFAALYESLFNAKVEIVDATE